MHQYIVCTTGISGLLMRDITPSECNWLGETLKKGIVLFKYTGQTFGSITPYGVAVCFEPNEFPFIEVPIDAVLWEK